MAGYLLNAEPADIESDEAQSLQNILVTVGLMGNSYPFYNHHLACLGGDDVGIDFVEIRGM